MNYLASLYGLKETAYEFSKYILQNFPQNNQYPSKASVWTGIILGAIAIGCLAYYVYKTIKGDIR